MTARQQVRILAVSSPGSRWAELNAIAAALGSEGTILVRASATPMAEVSAGTCQITDFSLFSIWKLPVCALQLFWLALRHRPQIIISTGAAPGIVALAVGRLLGARCVWIESLTSTEGMSLSGRIAGRIANTWLTQWPDLAGERGPHFRGAVL